MSRDQETDDLMTVVLDDLVRRVCRLRLCRPR